jgi:AraC family transcriptional regulator of adaptative response/methylated-DNA-[protein]-cysteine methyltransferase
MATITRLDPDTAWAAFMRRDRSWDGRIIGAVKSTGIYCKPSCPARRPKRENVDFYSSPEEARDAGYRPCLRCKPDEVGRDREAVAAAVRLIEQAEEAPSLGDLAGAVGYAPHHFQRLFKRDLGVSPAEYARGIRNKRTEEALKANGRVTDAVYDAGYQSPSGFYSDAKERLGMTPSAWRDGGRGETIRWTTFDSPLGEMLIAATSKGICRLTFDDSDASLKRLFPNATIVRDEGGLHSQCRTSRSMSPEPRSRKRCGASFARSPPGRPEAMPKSPQRSARPRQCGRSAAQMATITFAC